jgi:hypothetical protein
MQHTAVLNKLLISPPPPTILSTAISRADEKSLKVVAQINLIQTNNSKRRFSGASVRPINKNLNSNKIEQKKLKINNLTPCVSSRKHKKSQKEVKNVGKKTRLHFAFGIGDRQPYCLFL